MHTCTIFFTATYTYIWIENFYLYFIYYYILYYYVREDNVVHKIRNGSCLVLLRCLVKNKKNISFQFYFQKKVYIEEI